MKQPSQPPHHPISPDAADATLPPAARSQPREPASLNRELLEGEGTLAEPRSPSAHPADSPLPQQLPTAFGRYRLLRLLGKGGMGLVYLAHDSQLDRPVALKVPHFAAAEGSQVLERFYREARAAATILHPNICPLYDVGAIDGVPYLTMAYVEGKPLAEFAVARPLTPRQAALLLRKLALALAEAHKRGVIHRDLKPGNVMIDRRGEPMVMDFGLARRARGGDARLTQLGTALGTPAYMPPEQISGDVAAMGPGSDVYSLGVILYELLTGRLPFSGDAMAMLSQVLLDEPSPPSRLRPGLDPVLEAICLKAMAKKVQDRYGSMAELATALTDYLRKTPAATDETAPATPAPAPLPAGGSPTQELRVGQMDPPCPASAAGTAKRSRRRRGKKPGRRVPVWLWLAGAGGVVVLLLVALVVPRTPKYGTIKVDVSEAAGEVELRVDGETGHHVGETLRLLPGEHRLDVSARGYAPLHQQFHVDRGVNPELHVSLVRLPALLVPVAGQDQGQAGPVKVGPVRRIAWPKANVLTLAFTPDSRRLLVGADEPPYLRLFDVAAGTEVLAFAGHTSWVNQVVISPDGQFALSAGNDRTMRAWNMASGKPIGLPSPHEPAANCLALYPDGKEAVSADANFVYGWNLYNPGTRTIFEKPASRPLFPGDTASYRAVAISPDGKHVLTASADRRVTLYRKTYKEVRSFAGGVCAAFSPDGKSILTGGGDTVRLWDAASGEERGSYRGTQQDVQWVSFAPNGEWGLATDHGGHALYLWDLRGKQLLQCVKADRELQRGIVSPDCRYLACGSYRGFVYLWPLTR